jgi:hypothetical protein
VTLPLDVHGYRLPLKIVRKAASATSAATPTMPYVTRSMLLGTVKSFMPRNR